MLWVSALSLVIEQMSRADYGYTECSCNPQGVQPLLGRSCCINCSEQGGCFRSAFTQFDPQDHHTLHGDMKSKPTHRNLRSRYILGHNSINFHKVYHLICFPNFCGDNIFIEITCGIAINLFLVVVVTIAHLIPGLPQILCIIIFLYRKYYQSFYQQVTIFWGVPPAFVTFILSP